MKKLIKSTLVIGLLSLSVLMSCSKKELSHEEKIKDVVEVYLTNFFKNEPILEFKIDSVNINNITPKIILEKEALKLNQETNEALNEATLLSEKAKNFQILGLSTEHLKEEFETYRKKAEESSALAQKKAQESLKADSVSVLYYDVEGRGTITTLENVQNNAIFPFHISKDYKITKEPTELRKEQLKNN